MIIMYWCQYRSGRFQLTLTPFAMFSVLAFLTKTLSYRLTLFPLWNNYKYMSVWQVSYNIDLIFRVHLFGFFFVRVVVCCSSTISTVSNTRLNYIWCIERLQSVRVYGVVSISDHDLIFMIQRSTLFFFSSGQFLNINKSNSILWHLM